MQTKLQAIGEAEKLGFARSHLQNLMQKTLADLFGDKKEWTGGAAVDNNDSNIAAASHLVELLGSKQEEGAAINVDLDSVGSVADVEILVNPQPFLWKNK